MPKRGREEALPTGDARVNVIKMCREGDVEQLRAVHDEGYDLNRPYGSQIFPLFALCSNPDLDAFKFGLSKVDCLQATDRRYRSALYFLSYYGYADHVRYFLMEVKRRTGQAVLSGMLDGSNDDGETPLIAASQRGHVAVARVLLAHGASIPDRDERGRTALHHASGGGFLEIVQLLITEERWQAEWIDITADNGWTALHYAGRNNRPAVVVYLAGKGAKVDFANEDEQTPLHLACSYGCEEAVGSFLSVGARVDSVDDFDQTPLHLACIAGRPEPVRKLLAKGADQRAVDKTDNKNTPRDLALKHGHVAVLLVLDSHSKSDESEGISDALGVLGFYKYEPLSGQEDSKVGTKARAFTS